MLSCQSKEPGYQKKIIDFKKMDFNSINTEKFYHEASKEENLELSSDKQYVEISDFDNGWVEFQVKKSSDSDVVAHFDSINFATINAIASKEGKLKIINAETYLTPEEVNKLYVSLIKHFGKETKIETDDYGKYSNIYTYTWDSKDRVVKLVSIFNPKIPETLEVINSRIPDKESKIINERPKTVFASRWLLL